MKMKKDIFILCVLILLCSILVFATNSKTPEMELRITDTNQVFTVKVINNGVTSTVGPSENPDMIVSMTSATFAEIFNAKDPSLEAYNQFKKGTIGYELKVDYATLALKGYKGMYDGFAASHSIGAQ